MIVRDEEVVGRHLAPPPGRGHDRATEGGEAERELGGGVGVGDDAADGAAVAGDEVADVGKRLARERDGRAAARVGLARR